MEFCITKLKVVFENDVQCSSSYIGYSSKIKINWRKDFNFFFRTTSYIYKGIFTTKPIAWFWIHGNVTVQQKQQLQHKCQFITIHKHDYSDSHHGSSDVLYIKRFVPCIRTWRKTICNLNMLKKVTTSTLQMNISVQLSRETCLWILFSFPNSSDMGCGWNLTQRFYRNYHACLQVTCT